MVLAWAKNRLRAGPREKGEDTIAPQASPKIDGDRLPIALRAESPRVFKRAIGAMKRAKVEGLGCPRRIPTGREKREDKI